MVVVYVGFYNVYEYIRKIRPEYLMVACSDIPDCWCQCVNTERFLFLITGSGQYLVMLLCSSSTPSVPYLIPSSGIWVCYSGKKH